MLHSLVRPHRLTPVALALVFTAPALFPLAGQAPSGSDARLQGVVLDQSTYQPVDSATVSLVGTDMTVTTGKWGAFAFPDAPLGPVSVRVSKPGHPTMTEDVEVKDGHVMYVQIALPSVTAMLNELLVRTGRPRKASSEDARTAADMLADRVPRARMHSGIVGKTDFVIQLRAATTLTGSLDPIILIDGVMLANSSDAFEALERIPASDVDEIEILQGAEAFKYPYSANGVINVKTKKGKNR